MNRKLVVFALALAAIAMGLSGCGGGPTSPSGANAVIVRGVLLGGSASVTASAASGVPSTSSGPITVTVEGAGISTTISGNGSFEFENVPAGTFTLVFTKDGVEIGRLTITADAGMEVEIVVKLESSSVVLVDLNLGHTGSSGGSTGDTAKTCMIEGGRIGDRIELEGSVASGGGTSFKMTTSGNRASFPVDVSASAASFKCNGGDKKTTAECQASVKSPAQVHVRGTLTTCTLSNALITASEVMVQKSGGS